MPPLPRLRPLLRIAAIPGRKFHVAPARADIPFLPRILQPSTYAPSYNKPRSSDVPQSAKKSVGKKGWNPSTFFIWIFLLIGSQAIQQIALKHDHEDFMRTADVRIAALREVIEKLGRGEEVDVERMLGTGDERMEKEWEEVLKEIEEDDVLWKARQLQREAQEKMKEAAAAGEEERRTKKEADSKREKGSRVLTAEDYDFA